MASIGSCRSAGHIDGRSERADDVAFEEADLRSRYPVHQARHVLAPSHVARPELRVPRLTAREEVAYRQVPARPQPRQTGSSPSDRARDAHGVGADVGQPVPAQMWATQSRRRCGPASPGADVGDSVPAQMWASQSRRRCGPASPGADVGQPVPVQMWSVRAELLISAQMCTRQAGVGRAARLLADRLCYGGVAAVLRRGPIVGLRAAGVLEELSGAQRGRSAV
jgi:hypothetical protein